MFIKIKENRFYWKWSVLKKIFELLFGTFYDSARHKHKNTHLERCYTLFFRCFFISHVCYLIIITEPSGKVFCASLKPIACANPILPAFSFLITAENLTLGILEA